MQCVMLASLDGICSGSLALKDKMQSYKYLE